MSDIAISVENLGKQYTIGRQQEGYSTLRDTLTKSIQGMFSRSCRHKMERETIWALKNINFELKQGEVLGIIGRNGSGKTTLLKILSRITDPTEGRVRLRGRVGSLLEVGTGFHPELTGRENIYLSGAVLGMRKAEIESKFDEIVTFAEVERFLDTQVKFYSSGMYMRLAFSVAAHLEPEILLVDEVLAVGDAGFHKKCMGKMGEVAKEGRTVLFVSHNMGAISSICDNGILLEEGKLVFTGPVHKTISLYLDQFADTEQHRIQISKRNDRMGTGEVRLTDFYIEDATGEKIEKIRNGETIRLVFCYTTRSGQKAQNVIFQIVVRTESGELLFQFGTRFTGETFKEVPPKGRIVCEITRFPLVPGRYRLDSYLDIENRPTDYILWLASLIVVDGDYYRSSYKVFENESKFLVDGHVICESSQENGANVGR